MNKRVVTLVCAIMVILTFAAVAFARYDTCDACGGRLMKGDSRRYNIVKSLITCEINPAYKDTYVTYDKDTTWTCLDCGDEVVYTFRENETICGHSRDTGY